MIAHFEVIEPLKKYLKGRLYSFPLSVKSLPEVVDKEKITAFSITSYTIITDKLLDYFPKLRLIVTRSVGMDHINKSACKKRRVVVKNIPDYGAHNIAEHALALLLVVARNIIPSFYQVCQGKFSYKDFMGVGLRGKTLGVIGTGKIGLELIKLVKVFGMQVIAYDVAKNRQTAQEYGFNYVGLEKLLKIADFISLHVPLLPETKYLIGEKELKMMKKGAILINTSRGAIINTKALIKNIKKFRAVCLDVIEGEENFTKNNPLLKFNNVIITPHIGFFTDDSIKRIGEETMKIFNSIN